VPIVNATINNTTIGVTTPSVGNFTTIGATTQGTGAFTTLSASSTGLVTGTFGVGAAPVSEKMRVQAASGYNFVVDSASSSLRISSVNDADNANVPLILQGSTIKAQNSASDYLSITGSSTITAAIANSVIGTFSSTGLAVTGNLLVGTSSGSYSTISKSSAGNFVLEVQNTSATSPSVLNLKYTATSGGAGDFIQCNDNVGLKFIVAANGSVGIGASSPSYKLDVRVTGTGNVANFQSDGGPNIRFTGTETSGRTYQVGEGLVTAGSFSIYDTTGSAERLVINSSGDVGIGTSSPTAWGSGGSIEVNGSGGGIVAVKHNGTSKGYIAGESDKFSINGRFTNPIAFFTNGTERARIDSSGNLGVGTSSPKGKVDVVFGNTNPAGSNDVAIDALRLAGSGIAAISVRQYDSGGQPAAGDIQFLNLYFNGSTYNYYERARITAAGNLLVGKTADVLSNAGCLLDNRGSFTFTRDGATVGYINRLSSNGELLSFLKDTTQVGSISYNGSLTLYNQTSDYRLKDITGPLTDSGSFIDALKPKIGTWKSNGSKFVGFLAHEFAEVCPSAVTGEKDAVDSDGKPVHQVMQASTAEVIANLVAEIQQLRKRMAALESK